MLTTFSMWAVYFASYFFDYIIILVVLIGKQAAQSCKNNVPFFTVDNSIIWLVLVLFIIVSLFISLKIRNAGMNTRIRIIPEKNITFEITSCVLAQGITIATTIFTDWWIVIDIGVFVVYGLFFVKSGEVHKSPLFVFPLLNRVYKAGENIIITKYGLQEMRIAQEDNPDGLEARELANHIYYVKKQQ